MRQKSGRTKEPAEKVVRDIRRATRRRFSADEKIHIVLSGLRGEDSIAELCRHEGIAQSLYYSWSKEFLEAVDWTQSVLFPEAIAGRRVVICLQSAYFWGLQKGERYGKALFAPNTIRSGFMLKNEMREQVIRKVRSISAR